jgi:hypothetical protein
MDDFIDTVSLHPSIRAAALRGSLMMNKYYALTDDSIVFRISMSMFRILNGQIDDIDTHASSSSSSLQNLLFCQSQLET